MTPPGPRQGRARRHFDHLRDSAWSLLPAPVDRWIPATAIGYAAINAFTFGVDVGLLSLFYRLGHLPYPVAVSLGYAIALALSYLLNRSFNFHSHGRVGGELGRYVVAVVANYLAFVLGLSWLLQGLGVQYQLARILAAACEAVFMYFSMRWLVFTTAAPAEPDLHVADPGM